MSFAEPSHERSVLDGLQIQFPSSSACDTIHNIQPQPHSGTGISILVQNHSLSLSTSLPCVPLELELVMSGDEPNGQTGSTPHASPTQSTANSFYVPFVWISICLLLILFSESRNECFLQDNVNGSSSTECDTTNIQPQSHSGSGI